VAGPIAGGYLTEAKGWRAVFWILSILGAALAFLCFIFIRETYRVVLIQRKLIPLRKETGNQRLHSRFDKRLVSQNLFLHSITRPIKMLIWSPIVLLTGLYIGIVYGYFYLLFTTFTLVLEEKYGFSSGSIVLTYVVSIPKLISTDFILSKSPL
jgi:MFS family permease